MTTKLKITAIKPYPVWVGMRNQLLVKVETDEGIFGWGESGLSGREKAVVGAIEHYREFLIGRDPMQIGAIWQEMYRSQYFEGGRVLQAAISAIDIALHDIKGKALGVPVYELLGGKQRDRIPTFASTGDEAEGDDAIERARELTRTGLAGDPLLPRRAKQPATSSSRASRSARPRSDAEQGARGAGRRRRARHRLSPSAVGGRGGELLPASCRRGTLDFLEEPIRDETPEAYESLRTMTDVPFAIGEEFASKWQFLPYIERGIHQFNRHRRLQCRRPHRGDEGRRLERGALRRPDAAQPAWPGLHGRDRASRRRGAELRLARDQGARRAKLGFDNSDFFPVQPRLDGADYPVSDLPGLGVEVNEAAVQAESFRFWEAPHLKRRDGSVTNW